MPDNPTQSAGPGKKGPSFIARFKKFRPTEKSKAKSTAVPDTNEVGTTAIAFGDRTNASEPPQTISPLPQPRPPRAQQSRIRIPLTARHSSSSTATYVDGDGSRSPIDSYPTTLVGSPGPWSPKAASQCSLPDLNSTHEEKALKRPTSPKAFEANKENEGAQDEHLWCDKESRPAAHDHGDAAPPRANTPPPPLPPASSVTPAPLPAPSPSIPIPLRACPSGLPEAIWYLVAQRLLQHDLAHFAAVCSETRSVAESLMHRHPVIRDEESMISWAAALKREPTRAQLVQSLTVGWDGAEAVGGGAAIAFASASKRLRACGNLHTLNIFANAPEGRFGVRRTLPASVRTLNTSGAFFSHIQQPLPPLLHLSIRLHVSEMDKMRGPIALLKETLIQLRIVLRWPSPMRKREDNPVRLCAHLDVPKLVYFELREERSEDIPLRFSRSRWDQLPVGTSWSSKLAARMPSLKYLVWKPVWAEKGSDILPGGAYSDVVHGYRGNVFNLLCGLRVFAFVLPSDRYLCFERGVEKSRDDCAQAGPNHLWRAMREEDSGLEL